LFLRIKKQATEKGNRFTGAKNKTIAQADPHLAEGPRLQAQPETNKYCPCFSFACFF